MMTAMARMFNNLNIWLDEVDIEIRVFNLPSSPANIIDNNLYWMNANSA
jgi:hypothetical protein